MTATIPFPTYTTCCRILAERKHDHLKPQLLATCTPELHHLLEECYRNLENPDALKSIGETINQLGGFLLMQYVFYILARILPYLGKEYIPKLDDRREFVASTCMVESAWDGVGQWQA